MGNDFYTASSPLTVVGLNSVLNVTVLVRCIQPGKGPSRGLFHDYEIVTNLRSKLYNQNCCLGFCVEILWRAQRPGAAVRDLSVLLSDIPPASLASRCLSVVGLIIINLFYFGSYGSILWMSRKSHTNMALIKYKYKFSPPQGAVQRVGRLPAAADNCTNAQEQRRHFNSVFCLSAELSWVQLHIHRFSQSCHGEGS